MTVRNLRKMYKLADADDYREGCLAYERYHIVMQAYADEYNVPLDRTIAAFCALSPNNDYYGNLRSLASVLQGYRDNVPLAHIKVSTYRHCRDRAYSYVTGAVVFLDQSKGPKIRAFYHNLLNPASNRYVTVDGHMVAAWRAEELTMKQAIVRTRKEYTTISDGIKRLARREGLIPNQAQAIMWFARKRTRNIKYDPNVNMFGDATDKWRTLVLPSEAGPYPVDPEQLNIIEEPTLITNTNQLNLL